MLLGVTIANTISELWGLYACRSTPICFLGQRFTEAFFLCYCPPYPPSFLPHQRTLCCCRNSLIWVNSLMKLHKTIEKQSTAQKKVEIMLTWWGAAAWRQRALLAALMVWFQWWIPRCECCSRQEEDLGKIGCLRVVCSSMRENLGDDYQSDHGELPGWRDVGHVHFACWDAQRSGLEITVVWVVGGQPHGPH